METIKHGKASLSVNPSFGGRIIDCTLTHPTRGALPIFWNGEYSKADTWIHGGNPFLFPFAGRFPGPLHGELHAHVARVEGHDNRIEVVQVLQSAEVKHEYALSETSIRITTTIHNKGSSTLSAAPGWHPYFSLPEGGAQLFCQSEKMFEVSEGRAVRPGKSFSGQLELPSSFARNGILGKVGGQVRLIHSSGELIWKMDLNGFSYLVLWSPEGQPFQCIEPWSGLPDALENGVGLQKIPPGQDFRTEFRLSVC